LLIGGSIKEDDNMIQKIKDFFREVKIEIRKVVFPSRDEVLGSTKVVLILVLIVAVFLGLIDQILSKIVHVVVG
jgi:preprotein translocase subunit SecE